MDIFKRPSGTHRGNGLLEGAWGWGGGSQEAVAEIYARGGRGLTPEKEARGQTR